MEKFRGAIVTENLLIFTESSRLLLIQIESVVRFTYTWSSPTGLDLNLNSPIGLRFERDFRFAKYIGLPNI